MISVSELLLLLALLAVIVYWLDAMRAKEMARREGRQRCQELGLVFLDDSVVMQKLRLKRDEQGRMLIWRQYQFEFSSDGSRRYRGDIMLSGKVLDDLVMDAYRLPDEFSE